MKKETENRWLRAWITVSILAGFGHFGLGCWTKNSDGIIASCFMFVYAGLLLYIYQLKKRIDDNKMGEAIVYSILKAMARDFSRNGKLPKEEPKQETNESERTDESKD